MFITSNVALQNDINEQQPSFNFSALPLNQDNREERRREEMALHLHMKIEKSIRICMNWKNILSTVNGQC